MEAAFVNRSTLTPGLRPGMVKCRRDIGTPTQSGVPGRCACKFTIPSPRPELRGHLEGQTDPALRGCCQESPPYPWTSLSGLWPVTLVPHRQNTGERASPRALARHRGGTICQSLHQRQREYPYPPPPSRSTSTRTINRVVIFSPLLYSVECRLRTTAECTRARRETRSPCKPQSAFSAVQRQEPQRVRCRPRCPNGVTARPGKTRACAAMRSLDHGWSEQESWPLKVRSHSVLRSPKPGPGRSPATLAAAESVN